MIKNKNNKKKYLISSFLVGTLLFLVGCSSKNISIVSDENIVQPNNHTDFKKDESSTYGKVTDISSNQITLTIGTLNLGMNKGSQERPEISDGEKRPENSNRPEMFNEEERPEMITLSDEQTTITITDDIKITKMNMRKPNSENSNNTEEEYLSLEDISIGSILKVKYNKDKTEIESIELISSFNDNSKDDKKDSVENK